MEEITLRDVLPSDAPALAYILCTANEQTFRGLVPDQCLEFPETESVANWQRTLTDGLPDGDFMVMAVIPNGQVVGYAWSGANDKDALFQAELRQLMILPAYQRQGIGKRLMIYAAKHLLQRGLQSMRVEVLRINPNRAFYERLGAKYQTEYPYDWDGVALTMCVYGWPDIRSLLTAEPQ